MNSKWTADQIIEVLAPRVTDRRWQRIQQAIAGRTRSLNVVLENIYDRGNVSAVMRSAEAFGFLPIHMIDQPDAKFKAANRVTQGADKWLELHKHSDTIQCVKAFKAQGIQVLATDLKASKSLDECDFSKPTALVFGNEKEGISDEMREHADETVIFPMHGFTQSFNISVAAALCFHHVHNDRVSRLKQSGDLNDLEKRELAADYLVKSIESAEKILERELSASQPLGN